MSKMDKTKTDKDEKSESRDIHPLVIGAMVLSVCSLGWTTWSLTDLLGVGPIGLTVAATADLIWASVIWCEYKRIGGGWVKVLGVLAVLVVGGFIAWHGISRDNTAMAVAGPFLTIGTKGVWELALLSLRNPVADKKRETEEEIALLDAETETILKKADATIRKEQAQSKAEHERAIAAKKHEHELEMLDAKHEAEKEKLTTEHKSEILLTRLDSMNMEKILDMFGGQQVIQGQTVQQPQQIAPPQAPAFEPPQRPVPAVEQRSEVTVNVGGLTDAEKRLKNLAAAWYMAENDAASKGQLLSQAEFARRVDVQKAQVSRALKKFPKETLTPEDYDEAASA